MTSLLTIGQVSKQTDLSSKTIRFYETEGLIQPQERGENNYRLYSQREVDILKLIKQVRDIGLPLEQVKKLVKGCSDGSCDHTKHFVEKEIAEYAETVKKKVLELQQLEKRLEGLQKNLHKQKDDTCEYCCDILSQLTKMDTQTRNPSPRPSPTEGRGRSRKIVLDWGGGEVHDKI